ncbi:murein hydrolase activator EnvC family protein [Bacillus sp. FJAT-45066]|uniref:murein hydrolase activator EnvC family protein n=1 Tax=Bacillus sp. FJAT-45066 TaxID=2011010 RepID=UPI000BB726D0|nr:M23 family metallopeptidase [Bacillus sp. FJAT-45066]
MRRKIGIIIIAAVIGITGFFSTNFTEQVSANLEMKERLNDVKDDRESNQESQQAKKDEVSKLQAEQQKLREEVRKLDLAVETTKNNIRTKQSEIEATQLEIEELKAEIEVLIERIERRSILLEDRARSFQQGGGAINYLDVILGAQSFGDFLDRVNAVATILQADRDIMVAHQNDLQLLEEKELELRNKLVSLEQQLVELEHLEASLRQQIKQKDALMADLKKQEDEAMHELHELEDEAKLLAAQERAIKAEIKAYEERKKREEEERRQREEEERKRQEAEAAAAAAAAAARAAAGNSSPAPSSPAPAPAPAPTPPSPPPASNSGNFGVPATGAVTSGFGTRWGSFHAGIDIGRGGRSNVPVVASAAGTVFQSYYSTSYGNVVFITHNIDGQIWTTVYAHLENRAVSEGQSVSRGQFLGYMGNTGFSTGPHLHFELHRGMWNGNKTNAVNPRSFINF